MRRRLTLLVAATTSALVLAFLIPLALVMRSLAETRAISEAQNVAQSIVTSATLITDTGALEALIKRNASANSITLLLPDGNQLGQLVTDPQLQEAAKLVQAQKRRVDDGPLGPGYLVYAAGINADSGHIAVRVFVPEDVLHRNVQESTLVISGVALLALLAAGFAADRLAQRVIEPIYQVAEAAEALSQGDLDVRAPETGSEEVMVLGRALNGLASRIEFLLASERDAVADLSHRLRTPVTALRLDADGIRDPEAAERIRVHVAHLERTVDAVLRDARRPVRQSVEGIACDITKIVRERVSFWSALAFDQARVMHLTMPDREVRARLQSNELTDVVDVLLDNVFAHTDEGVEIEVTVTRAADGAPVLTVEDAGPGLPPGDVVSRGTSGAGSSGLGLDIVRRTAMASGGSLELGRSRLGGALIQVTFGAG